MLNKKKCNVRALRFADLEQVLHWRNSARIRQCMYTDHLISWEEHKAWFERLQERDDRECLLFEYEDEPMGLLSFTEIDNLHKTAFWGFYLGEPSSIKGLGLHMGVLGIDYAFEKLQLRKLCGEAIAFNQGSVQYHLRLGFKQEGLFSKHIIKNNKYEDIVRFAIFKEQWEECRRSIVK